MTINNCQLLGLSCDNSDDDDVDSGKDVDALMQFTCKRRGHSVRIIHRNGGVGRRRAVCIVANTNWDSRPS